MSKRRTIFIDGHVLTGIPQGTVTYIKGLYRAINEINDFELIFGVDNIELASNQLAIPDAKLIAYNSSNKFYRLAYNIPSIIAKYKCDLSHFQYIVPFVKNSKQIVTIHDVIFLDFPNLFPYSYRLQNKYLFDFAAKKSDLVCTVSNYSKEKLKEHFLVPEEKLHVTPNATFMVNSNENNIDIKSKYGLSKYILFVSRIEPRKNHLQLLKAYIELKLYEKDYSLVFIGSNAIKSSTLSEFLDKLTSSIKNKIIFLNQLNDSELSSFYIQADLFVFPSLAEGFGIPPLEAALNHTKVLCSNATAMNEFTFFAKYNLLFDPNNLKEFKEKITLLLKERQYPYDKIKNEIESKYNWDSIATNFIKRIHGL